MHYQAYMALIPITLPLPIKSRPHFYNQFSRFAIVHKLLNWVDCVKQEAQGHMWLWGTHDDVWLTPQTANMTMSSAAASRQQGAHEKVCVGCCWWYCQINYVFGPPVMTEGGVRAVKHAHPPGDPRSLFWPQKASLTQESPPRWLSLGLASAPCLQGSQHALH